MKHHRRMLVLNLPERMGFVNLTRDVEQAVREPAREPDLVSANIDLFAAAVGLDELERAVFRFVYYTDSDSSFGALCTRIVGTRTYYALRSSQIAALVASIRINYLN